MLLADDKATLTTRLVEGDYPKYQALIPESSTGRAVVSKEQFLQASRRQQVERSSPKNSSSKRAGVWHCYQTQKAMPSV
jgi:DNA polymerase III sliding clamp (beta) subunit (PCNA family)